MDLFILLFVVAPALILTLACFLMTLIVIKRLIGI
jgi:hypothetical protein